MFTRHMTSTSEDIRRRCSLPALSTITSRDTFGGDICEDRRLPPLQHVVPFAPGPFNNPFVPIHSAPSPPSSQDSFPLKGSWSAMDHFVTPPSPTVSAAGSWQESLTSQKPTDWPCDLSPSEMMALICPAEINRKPPLQQLCGRKRKSSLISGGDPDDQREKHRIAEGNRRKNLSQLHRELDSRIHDYFLERAGWNPAKSLPQSKEHIVLAAIFLIDFMRNLIVQLMKQENESSSSSSAAAASQLHEKLQPQVRCMQLQQQVSALQQETLAAQEQIKTLKQQNDELVERNRALEFQLKSHELMFRTTPKSESTSPRPLSTIPEDKQCNMLPGLRLLCDGIASITSDAAHPLTTSFASRNTPSMTAPPSPAYPPYSQSGSTISRRESLSSTPTSATTSTSP